MVIGADEPDKADIFARLASDLYATQTVAETADMVVQFALKALGCTHAGAVLSHGRGHSEVAAVTDPALTDLYLAQIETGDGPLVDVLTGRRSVLLRDVGSDPDSGARWPGWRAQATRLGVASVLAVPMNISDRTVGVLIVYDTRPNAFDSSAEATADLLARHAAVAVATARHEEALGHAIDARRVVGQAMGILMERYDVDGDQAFAILRRYSQDTNTKLHDIARQLIDRRTLPSHPDPSVMPPRVRSGPDNPASGQ